MEVLRFVCNHFFNLAGEVAVFGIMLAAAVFLSLGISFLFVNFRAWKAEKEKEITESKKEAKKIFVELRRELDIPSVKELQKVIEIAKETKKEVEGLRADTQRLEKCFRKEQEKIRAREIVVRSAREAEDYLKKNRS